MAYSTIPAAVDRLLVVLAARAGLAGVLIVDGHAAELPSVNEAVIVEDPTNWRGEWAQLGQLRIDESYTLRVYVETYMPGSDRAACRARLYALVAEIQQAVVLDIALAGIANWAAKPNGGDPKVLPTDDGWVGQVALQFDCSARIQAS
jgi:hypothetical protein